MKCESKLAILCVLFMSCCWSFSSVADAGDARALSAIKQVAPGKVLSVNRSHSKVTVRVLTEKGRVETYEWTPEGGVRVKGAGH